MQEDINSKEYCPINTSIHHSEEICKRPLENNLLESVKTVSEPYVVSIMISMFQAGYHGKTVDMECRSDRHRTNILRFLRNESTCDDTLASSMKQRVIQLIYMNPNHPGTPFSSLSITRPALKLFHHLKLSIRLRLPVFTFLI